MTKKELFDACREGVIELKEMEQQLRMLGHDGRPAGVRGLQPDSISGTNHPAASAWQIADGLEACIERKREEVNALAQQALAMMAKISNLRTYLIVQHYYLMAETDDQISAQLALTRGRVNQLRLAYLHAS